MSSFEVPEPILNSPYEEPSSYWYLREGDEPQQRPGRRPSIVYPPRDGNAAWNLGDVLVSSPDFDPGYELLLVNRIREGVKRWREDVLRTRAGVTRTTLELMQYWRREGREKRLFYAQLEAAETVIFLTEARSDYLQGITVPMDEPSSDQQAEGVTAFLRYACKMATGSGKTTVMGMLAAWSILNKVESKGGDARFSDVVLVVCPNVTIKNRLLELDPNRGDASLYRTRDLVPQHLMPYLTQGRVLVTNWHLFEKQQMNHGGDSSRVLRTGVEEKRPETIRIGDKSTTARGKRYLTEDDYRRQVDLGLLRVIDEKRDTQNRLESVRVETTRYVESDTAWMNRVLGQEIGGKQNILVFNDEAHHAYRIRRDEPDEEDAELFEDEEDAEDYVTEATIWIEGLDRIHRLRGINRCVDLSATPYYLGRVGQDTNKPFPWVVSDFALTDAIESGLVKIPQLAVRDTSGQTIGGDPAGGAPAYFNIWRWLMPKLTSGERGAQKASPKPEAVLKYAHTPIAMLGGLWEQVRQEWLAKGDEPRPPVFIIVCKNTKIAKVIYEWIAEGEQPSNVAPARLEGFRNKYAADGSAMEINTIRVDTKVVHETDSGTAKGDEVKWMRFTLDTVGKTTWTTDRQGRPIYPDGFEELATKLKRPLHPPGRDLRCIVSVGMLTEGWDCNTVTHIVGLRPFMSQLLCEQVVGRGLRRASYQPDADGKLPEEVAKVFGVPFDVIPFKANAQGPTKPPEKRHHVRALPGKAQYAITFPRVEGFVQRVRNKVTVDWDTVPTLTLDPQSIPPEAEMQRAIHRSDGRPSIWGPNGAVRVDLNPYRSGHRRQELAFDLTATLTRAYSDTGQCEVPPQALFPQLLQIVDRYLTEKVVVNEPCMLVDVFLSPYYGWAVEKLTAAIRPDTSVGESPELPKFEQNRDPGTTADVSFWTSRDVREVNKSHLNYAVADTRVWEQSATYFVDTHHRTLAFVKNSGLGFTVPYTHNGAMHDYIPDFLVRLRSGSEHLNLILEVKGHDELAGVKRAAAQRWVDAVNADGRFGTWRYAMAMRPSEVRTTLDTVQ